MSRSPEAQENVARRGPGLPDTIWITGLSASGKTNLSKALASAFRQHGYPCTLLDGEELRRRMGNRYGHSVEERFAVVRDIVAVALEERSKGAIPIVATISHKREMRSFAKRALGRVLEVYLDCPASICAARDYKGHYRRAYAGEYDCFIGVTEPYEVWDKAEIVIDTARLSIAEAAEALLAAALDFLSDG